MRDDVIRLEALVMLIGKEVDSSGCSQSLIYEYQNGQLITQGSESSNEAKRKGINATNSDGLE